MPRTPSFMVCAALLGLSVACPSALAQFTPLGPTPYLSFADSPLQSSGLNVFYLETFEDGLLDVPGVTAINNTPGRTLSVGGQTFFTDSVDADDGVIDGLGRDGFALADTLNLPTDDLGYTFRFDSGVLGQLPTHVGIVWTDGSFTAPTQLEVYDGQGSLLGMIGPVDISDNSFAGETAEDRFFGAIHGAGIGSIVIRSPGGQNNLTVDHLQYGFNRVGGNVPEPSSVALLVGMASVSGIMLRRRRK